MCELTEITPNQTRPFRGDNLRVPVQFAEVYYSEDAEDNGAKEEEDGICPFMSHRLSTRKED